MTAIDIHEQLLVSQLPEFVPGYLKLINDVELTLTILLAIPEILDLLLQFAVNLGEQTFLFLVYQDAYFLIYLLNLVLMLHCLVPQRILMIPCLDQGGVDQVLQNLRLLELHGQGVSLLLRRLVYRADFVVLVRAREYAVDAKHLPVRLAIAL